MSVGMAVVLACAGAARADDGVDVQAAARAFQEGQRAQLRGDAAEAARLYELADSIAATPQALRSAIRSRLAAGHAPRAATLALAAQARYPDDPESAALAAEVLAGVGSSLARIAVECGAPCAVLCDGRAVSTDAGTQLEFFVDAGAHAIEVHFAERSEAHETVDLAAGERRELRFDPPARFDLDATAALPAPEPAPPAAPVSRVQRERSNPGLPLWVFLTAAGVTAAATGAALASGLDTIDKRDAYRTLPTRSGYERGVDSQVRTNALLVTAGALLAVTTGLAFFTDWDGDESIAPSFAASKEGAVLMFKRSFQ